MEKYSVQKVIGEGSFGRALLVLSKDSQEKFVVKEIQLPKVFPNSDGDRYDLYPHNATRRRENHSQKVMSKAGSGSAAS